MSSSKEVPVRRSPFSGSLFISNIVLSGFLTAVSGLILYGFITWLWIACILVIIAVYGLFFSTHIKTWKDMHNWAILLGGIVGTGLMVVLVMLLATRMLKMLLI